MVTVDVIDVNVLQATLIVNEGVARVALELLDYEFLWLRFVLLSYASIKHINVFYDFELVAFGVNRSYEFL